MKYITSDIVIDDETYNNMLLKTKSGIDVDHKLLLSEKLLNLNVSCIYATEKDNAIHILLDSN